MVYLLKNGGFVHGYVSHNQMVSPTDTSSSDVDPTTGGGTDNSSMDIKNAYNTVRLMGYPAW